MSSIIYNQVPEAHSQLMARYKALIEEVNQKPKSSLLRALVEDHIRDKLGKLSHHYLHLGMEPAAENSEIRNWLLQTASECKNYAESMISLAAYFSLPYKILKIVVIVISSVAVINIYGESKNFIEILISSDLRNTLADFIKKYPIWIAAVGIIIEILAMMIIALPVTDAAYIKTSLFKKHFTPITIVNQTGKVKKYSLEGELFRRIGLVKSLEFPLDLIGVYFLLSIGSFFAVMLLHSLHYNPLWVYWFYIIGNVIYLLGWHKHSEI